MSDQQLAACAGKVAYPTWGHADRAAKRRRGRTVYRCTFCGAFHFGTIDRKFRK